ncbi:FAD/NAD(P)-binding protein [Cellulophaga sp. F20128]|uniref:FAD/NAD(P)-binding protein n=1 Tax=Cellulophaga sp. F20128 TaxID=2926413 RepID=UPI001FF330F2|nr:FAD/NAD(P)-binding protein [Cellulophaga sp. F20128]MCK0157759.1 FAD/NAD(P)-binding protein [Cellulophaga sp. F20128]
MRKVGIIGIGPRGGYALERLIVELAEQNSLINIHISLFETTGNFGNGQVYDLDQNASNWINITERVLALEGRKAINTETVKIKPFPSYHEWINKDFSTLSENEIDTYPPRAKLGKFLVERFQSLIKPLLKAKIVSLHKEQAIKIEWIDYNQLQIITDSTRHNAFDEILLTIGHQSTELSNQLLDWDKYAKDNENTTLFKSPYPVDNFLNHNNLTSKSTIAIRGFGLAMIDVVRAIAEKFGGFYINQKENVLCTYQTEHAIKNLFIPFSLDGLPPVPKPLNARIDSWFKPSKASILSFEKQIGNTQIQKDAESPHFLLAAFAPIAASVFSKLKNANNIQNLSKQEIEKLIMLWLNDQSIAHALITPTKQSAEKSMRNFEAMATGNATVSLDYCIGQVWRHCQPTIYRALSFNDCSDEVFVEIIALDESTKRYSYGPPVESIQQLLALAKADILNLNMINDPNIELITEGWQFEHSGKSLTATILIDSVLDSPKINAVRSPLVQNMLDDGLIKVVHDDLGVTTNKNGYLISNNKNQKVPIALLGRLAKGTIIGVDAILECFGARPRQWAQKATQNHMDWLNKN